MILELAADVRIMMRRIIMVIIIKLCLFLPIKEKTAYKELSMKAVILGKPMSSN